MDFSKPSSEPTWPPIRRTASRLKFSRTSVGGQRSRRWSRRRLTNRSYGILRPQDPGTGTADRGAHDIVKDVEDVAMVRGRGDALADVLVHDLDELGSRVLLGLDEETRPGHRALAALVEGDPEDSLRRRRRAVVIAATAGEAVEKDDPSGFRPGSGHAGKLRDVPVKQGVLEDTGQARPFPIAVVGSPRHRLPLARWSAPSS
jgi:hypothetical protein